MTIDDQRRTILFLGGSMQQIPVLQRARRDGHRIVLCDYLPDNPGRHLADEYHPVSTTDVEAVLAVARSSRIHGIAAYASDPAAATAAIVAERLGLPGNPPDAVLTLTRKSRFRAFQAREGYPHPEYHADTDLERLARDAAGMRFPIMVKPDDSSGSKGVSLVLHVRELPAAIASARMFSKNGMVIVEEHVERSRPLIGGDLFLLDGEIVCAFLGDQYSDLSGNRFVPAGMTFPARISDALRRQILEDLSRMLRLAGYRNGGVNLEVLVDKSGRPFVVELGPRSGGNYIPVLAGYAMDADMVGATVDLALGKAVEWTSLDTCRPVSYHAIHTNRAGVLNDIHFSERLRPLVLETHLYRKKGDAVEGFSHAGHAIGILLMAASDEAELLEIVSSMESHVKVALQEEVTA